MQFGDLRNRLSIRRRRFPDASPQMKIQVTSGAKYIDELTFCDVDGVESELAVDSDPPAWLFLGMLRLT